MLARSFATGLFLGSPIITWIIFGIYFGGWIGFGAAVINTIMLIVFSIVLLEEVEYQEELEKEKKNKQNEK